MSSVFFFSVCSVVLSSATIFNEITSPRGVGGRGGKGSQSFVCLDIIGAPEDRRGYETPRLSSYLRTLAGIRFPSFRRNHRVSLAVEFARKEKIKESSRDFTPLFCSQHHRKNLPLFTFDVCSERPRFKEGEHETSSQQHKNNNAETG